MSPSTQRTGDPRVAATAFAIASFLAVSSGCLVAASTGVGPGIWGRNAAAWVVGAVLAWLLARVPPARLVPAALLLTPLALLGSLFAPGQSGVHRWIQLGPLTWNAAFLFLPGATVAAASAARIGSRWLWAAPAIQCELCLQPDASQATAFAAAMIVVLLGTTFSRRTRATAILFFLLAVAFAWSRPDPLQPVPEVEGIIDLARTISPALAIFCVASLAAATLSPLFALNRLRPGPSPPSSALSVYFLACAISAMTPRLGAFPIPLVGMGMSPVIGFWLGLGALMATRRSLWQTREQTLVNLSLETPPR